VVHDLLLGVYGALVCSELLLAGAEALLLLAQLLFAQVGGGRVAAKVRLALGERLSLVLGGKRRMQRPERDKRRR